MATIYYLDLISGNDGNSGLAWDLPKLTFAAVNTAATAGDFVRVAKTVPPSSVAGATYTWTTGSVTVGTSADVRASLAVGDLIGCTTAAGNGTLESYYSIAAITASAITLMGKYAGTTKSEASVNKITGTIVAAWVPSKVLDISGGWTLAASPTRDSETWIRLAGATGGNICNFAATGCFVSYINFMNFTANAVVSSQVTGAFYSNCSFCAYSSAITSIGINFGTVQAGGTVVSTGAYYGFAGAVVQAGATAYALGGHPTSGSGFYNGTITGTAVSSYNGYGFNGPACYGPCTAVGCLYGFNSYLPCIGSIANSCTTGFTDCQIMINTASSNCNTGVYFGNAYDCYIDGHTSTSDVVGFLAASSRPTGILVGCNIITPVNWGISQPLNSQGVKCIGCTIDTPSLSKAYQITTGGNYSNPKYYLQNSFGKNGLVYTNASVMQDVTTTPYSMQLVFSGTSGLQYAPLKIASLYGKQNTELTVSISYWAPSGSWVGSMVPYLKLNGRTIITGSTISSITSSPSTLTFNITQDMMTSDGELSIELVPNCNSIATNWGNLSVVGGSGTGVGQMAIYNGCLSWLSNERPLEMIDGAPFPVLASFDGPTYMNPPWMISI
jgi:hypothetical protein